MEYSNSDVSFTDLFLIPENEDDEESGSEIFDEERTADLIPKSKTQTQAPKEDTMIKETLTNLVEAPTESAPTSDDDQLEDLLDINNTRKKQSYKRIAWQVVGEYSISADVYISRALSDGLIWIKSYTRPKLHYDVFRCIDPNCPSQLKIHRVHDSRSLEKNAMNSIVLARMEEQSELIQVFRSSEHAQHNEDLMKEAKERRLQYGMISMNLL